MSISTFTKLDIGDAHRQRNRRYDVIDRNRQSFAHQENELNLSLDGATTARGKYDTDTFTAYKIGVFLLEP